MDKTSEGDFFMVGKIAFIGGDLRMPEAARFAKKNCDVLSVYGFDNYEYCHECFGISEETSPEAAVFGAEAIVLGLPCSPDGVTLFAPYCSKEIEVKRLIAAISPHSLLLGGKLTPDIKALAQEKNILCHDYFDREELTLKNALITAEGALQTAMAETAHTIHSSKCLVLGYGRIGRFLSAMLKSLGASVTCTARNTKDLALIECDGMNAVHTYDAVKSISDYDIIFNTIALCVLPEEVLSFVRTDTLIIDLASKPGGLDFESARRLGLKVIWATSLPGKVAPETSGKIIAETVFNIINELQSEVKK